MSKLVAAYMTYYAKGVKRTKRLSDLLTLHSECMDDEDVADVAEAFDAVESVPDVYGFEFFLVEFRSTDEFEKYTKSGFLNGKYAHVEELHDRLLLNESNFTNFYANL